MFVNRQKLKARLYEKGIKVQDLAREMDISAHALSLKLNNKRRFNEEEIAYLCKRLGTEIFFLE